MKVVPTPDPADALAVQAATAYLRRERMLVKVIHGRCGATVAVIWSTPFGHLYEVQRLAPPGFERWHDEARTPTAVDPDVQLLSDPRELAAPWCHRCGDLPPVAPATIAAALAKKATRMRHPE